MTVTVTSALAGPATARYSNIYGALVDLGVLSGLGAQDVTGSGDPVAPILNASQFYAPLTSSLILTRGTGDPTFTRATVAWEFDNEGKLILVPSGAARFGGARMVRNTLTNSEDLSNAVWAKSNGATITGTNQLNLTTDSDCKCKQDGNAATVAVVGSVGVFSVKLSGTGDCYLRIYDRGGSYQGTNSSKITLTATPTRYSISRTLTDSAATRFGVQIGNLLLGTAATVIVEEAQLEVVTGQADQTASEYVSVGVLSAPFHGAGVDGVKWFDTNKDGSAISESSLLGYHAEGSRTNSLLYSRDLRNSTTSYVSWSANAGIGTEKVINGDFSSSTDWDLQAGVTISGGKLNFSTAGNSAGYKYDIVTTGKQYYATFTIDSISSGGVRIVCGNAGTIYTAPGTYTNTIHAISGTVGLKAIGATTAVCDNLIIYEATTQVTTCTGIDNVPNSASTLTAGAADATILQTLSLAAAARSSSAYVKRRTGTGNVYFTRDGGTSWTDITSSLGASWTRVKIENTSVLNPSVGFKIATSGDAIDVDCVQDEAGSFVSSPIVTTTAAVTRNADAETFQTASNWSDTAGWALATVQGESWANATGTAIGNGTNGLKLSASNSGIVAYDGTNTVNGPAGSPSGVEKLAMTWGSGALQAASGGVAGSAGSYDGAWGLATIGIGTSQGNVYIKDVYIGQSALTDAQLQQVTA